jgi:hypothetical protein
LNDVCVTCGRVPGDVVNFSGSLDLNMFSTDAIVNGVGRPLFGRVHLTLTMGDVAIADTAPRFIGVALPVQRFTMQGRVSLDGTELTPPAARLHTLVTSQGNVFAALVAAQGASNSPSHLHPRVLCLMLQPRRPHRSLARC